MKISRKRIVVYSIIGGIILFALALFYYYNQQQKQQMETFNKINLNLSAGEVKLYLEEEQLINLLGEGEYIEGFGGHQRNYKNQEVKIGIAGDSDNDFYGRVSLIEFSNPKYSIYGVKIGDSSEESKKVIMEQGYKHLVEDLFGNGEYVIAIVGKSKVNLIQIWFDDKDLRDRNY